LGLLALAQADQDGHTMTDKSELLNIPPRYMWGWDEVTPLGGPLRANLSGFCGSCSIQSAALYYGNWVTQNDVRMAVGNAEVLLGYNALEAVTRLRMRGTEWNNNGSGSNVSNASVPIHARFFAWANVHITMGNPVILGVYMREFGGDDDYDHIVPMVGYHSTPNPALFLNDLHSNSTMKYKLDERYISSREGCRPAPGQTMNKYDYCLPASTQYAIAVTGNVDDTGETFPVRLEAPLWYEPDYSTEDARYETPLKMRVTAHITGLTPGANYMLLRFEGVRNVPHRHFSNGNYSRSILFTALGGVHTIKDQSEFFTNVSVFYRCVQHATATTKSHDFMTMAWFMNSPFTVVAVFAVLLAFYGGGQVITLLHVHASKSG